MLLLVMYLRLEQAQFPSSSTGLCSKDKFRERNLESFKRTLLCCFCFKYPCLCRKNEILFTLQAGYCKCTPYQLTELHMRGENNALCLTDPEIDGCIVLCLHLFSTPPHSLRCTRTFPSCIPFKDTSK